jgi:hypothetical protein
MPTPSDVSPRAISVERFGMVYGPGRSLTYQLIAEGKITARKIGRKTVIDVESADRWYASLPPAEIRQREPEAA